MASANLDLVRSLYAEWERGDYSSVDWADPEIELVFADGPAPGRWTGLAGLAEGWRSFLGAWEGFRTEVEEAASSYLFSSIAAVAAKQGDSISGRCAPRGRA